jgi:hypothetical protein
MERADALEAEVADEHLLFRRGQRDDVVVEAVPVEDAAALIEREDKLGHLADPRQGDRDVAPMVGAGAAGREIRTRVGAEQQRREQEAHPHRPHSSAYSPMTVIEKKRSTSVPRSFDVTMPTCWLVTNSIAA